MKFKGQRVQLGFYCSSWGIFTTVLQGLKAGNADFEIWVLPTNVCIDYKHILTVTSVK